MELESCQCSKNNTVTACSHLTYAWGTEEIWGREPPGPAWAPSRPGSVWSQTGGQEVGKHGCDMKPAWEGQPVQLRVMRGRVRTKSLQIHSQLQESHSPPCDRGKTPLRSRYMAHQRERRRIWTQWCFFEERQRTLQEWMIPTIQITYFYKPISSMRAGTEFFISTPRAQYTAWHIVGTQQKCWIN